MFELMRKYKVAFFVLTLMAVGTIILFQLSDDEALAPGEEGGPQRAVAPAGE